MNQLMAVIGMYLVVSFGYVTITKAINLPQMSNKHVHFLDGHVLITAIGACMLVWAYWRN